MKSKQEKPSDVAPFNSMTTRSLPLGSKSTLNPESKKRFCLWIQYIPQFYNYEEWTLKLSPKNVHEKFEIKMKP